MANKEIKETARAAGVKLWEVAEKLGMYDFNFSRKLRHELTDDEREKILSVIEEIKRERESGTAS